MASKVPDQFFGTFKLERSENFDEILAAKGVSWMFRKMMGMAGITKVIQPADDGQYNMKNLTAMKTVDYGNWKLNDQFEAVGMDGKMHKICFGVDGDALTEKHVRSGEASDPGETYRYTRDGDYLILTMNHKDITCKRFFKKVDE